MNTEYDHIIREFTEKIWSELDWKIIKCQVRQESNFNPKAVSPCGAKGLLQLMPATGRELGIKKESQLFYPEANLIAGITYPKCNTTAFPKSPFTRKE